MVELEDDYPIGLDLGTTNSCIGVYRNGGVEIIPNSIGERTTPSIVTILGDKILVGENTLEHLVKEVDHSFFEIKRLIGSRKDEAKVEIERTKKKEQYSPIEISAFIIKRMVAFAEKYLDKKIKKIVITVPAYFNDTQRKQTKRAAEAIGLNVLRIINEPTAAALAYGLEKNVNKQGINNNKSSENPSQTIDKRYILVFDLGGGTFDVSLLNINYSEKTKDNEVIATSGDTNLGGKDFDYKLRDYFLGIFCERHNLDINVLKSNHSLMKKLELSCEYIKKTLSKSNSTVLNLINFYTKDNNSYDIIQKITREEFERICDDLFNRLETPLDDAIKKAKLKPKDISEIVLVGGSTRIPKIKEIIKKKFPTSTKINDSINPDETVAYGATLEAAKILLKNDETISGINLFDITPLSLGIAVQGQNNSDLEMSVIIERGAKTPILNKQKRFQTSHDNQESVSIKIYEGEKKYVKDNHFLGEFPINDLEKRPKGEVKIDVTFNIDVNNILTVEAIENSKNNTNKARIINDRYDLTEEDMNKIREKNKKDFDELNIIDNNSTDYVSVKAMLKLFMEAYESNKNNKRKQYKAICNYCDTLKEFIDGLDGSSGKETKEGEKETKKGEKETKKGEKETKKGEKDIYENETLLEKYFIYVKDLFQAYVKALKVKDDDAEEIMEKMKNYIEKFSMHNSGYLYDLIEILKEIPDDILYEIVIYCMKLLNKNGKRCLEERKPFCKYNSIIYFEEVLNFNKTYIPGENNEDKKTTLASSINKDLLKSYLNIIQEATQTLDDINSGASILLNFIEGKELQLGTGTGFTNDVRKYKIFKDRSEEKEAYECLLKNYERAIRELETQPNRKSSEVMAFIYAKVINLDMECLGNKRFELYIKYAEECKRIASSIGIDENKEWYKEFLESDKILEGKKNEINEERKKAIEKMIKENSSKFEEINGYFKKGKEEFVNFILKNYEYEGYEEDKNKFDFKNVDSNLINHLSKMYHPMRYISSKYSDLDYAIMHEICGKINSFNTNT